MNICKYLFPLISRYNWTSYTTNRVAVVAIGVARRVDDAVYAEVPVPGAEANEDDWGPEVAVAPNVVQATAEVPTSGEVKWTSPYSVFTFIVFIITISISKTPTGKAIVIP